MILTREQKLKKLQKKKLEKIQASMKLELRPPE